MRCLPELLTMRRSIAKRTFSWRADLSYRSPVGDVSRIALRSSSVSSVTCGFCTQAKSTSNSDSMNTTHSFNNNSNSNSNSSSSNCDIDNDTSNLSKVKGNDNKSNVKAIENKNKVDRVDGISTADLAIIDDAAGRGEVTSMIALLKAEHSRAIGECHVLRSISVKYVIDMISMTVRCVAISMTV